MQSKLFQVTDPIHETIYLSGLEKELLSTPYFNRLHDVYQSSTVYMTFPGNRTKRYEHSIGTMQLASEIFYNTFANAIPEYVDYFFEQLYDEAFSILEKITTTAKYDPIDYAEETKRIVDHNIDKYSVDKYIKFITAQYDLRDITLEKYMISYYSKDDFRSILYNILLQAVRIVALFHDIGHPPYSHVVECALKDLYDETKKIKVKNSRQKSFCDILDNFLNNNNGNGIIQDILDKTVIIHNSDFSSYGELHESIGLRITDLALSQVIRERYSFLDQIEGDEDDKKKMTKIAFDADRMDYVVRDAKNCGLNWGKIPYKRLLNSAMLQMKEDAEGVKHFRVAYAEKNVDVLNDILLMRYKICTQINNHHKCVKTSTLLQNAVKIIARNYLKNDKDDKQSEYDNNISGLWKCLKEVHSVDTAIYKIMN